MSNKNLLNENTVRRFMKLAEIEPLTNQFVGKLNESEADLEERGPKPPMNDDDDVKEGRMKDNDDVKEGRMKGDDDKKGKLDEEQHDMSDDPDGLVDEDLDALLAEMELDEADMADNDMADDDMEDDDMDLEEPEDDMGPDPAMGGMDPEALKSMIKDAVMEALEELVDDGRISVDDDGGPEEVEVDAEEMDMMAPDMMEEDEMINEVAHRVLKRLSRSRR